MSAQSCSSRELGKGSVRCHKNVILIAMNGGKTRTKCEQRSRNWPSISASKTTLRSEDIMKKKTERRKLTEELRREYDLSKLKGVRGKYATRYQAGTNLVPLSPDVAKYFPDEQSVNTALRKLIHVTKVKKIS